MIYPRSGASKTTEYKFQIRFTCLQNLYGMHCSTFSYLQITWLLTSSTTCTPSATHTHTLTRSSLFLYFNRPDSFDLCVGLPSSCDRNATHSSCIWPPPGPRQCDVAFIISSGDLPFLYHLPIPSGTFFCHMASIHPASLCSSFCVNSLYI